MKSILVTGANGQLGSELRRQTDAHPNFQFTFVDVAELDLLDAGAIAAYFSNHSFDLIIHGAAYTAVDKAESEPHLCDAINAVAPGLIARAAKASGSKLIYISTDYVFDGEFNQPIAEDATPRPTSVYGATKLAGEQRVAAELPGAYVVRTAWVYSTFGKNFVKTIATLAKQREELTVVADQFGSPTYARDLASALLIMSEQILNNHVDAPGTYHYSNEGSISWFDFAVFIARGVNPKCSVRPIKTSEYKTAASRPKFSVLDKSKIKKVFGINIPHWSVSLDECLKNLEL